MQSQTGTPGPSPARAFFVDFDGTITDNDGFEVLTKHFASEDDYERAESALNGGDATLREILAQQTAFVRGSFDDVYALHVARIAIDPGFVPFVERCEARGIAVTVLSSGIGPLIRRRLDDAGLARIALVAPDAEVRPGGWRLLFRDDSLNGTDKAGAIRAAQARGARVAFAGDGRSDFDAAVAADDRFAKRGRELERFLRARALPFASFDGFGELETA